ncbi:MAG: helix-turn-helix transcriptional regulator [Clostridia bacterium]|nr:helix-turn-helix transcriptional regulator [Clostridia bacterium]
MDMKILECRRFAPPAPCTISPRVVKDYEIDVELGDGHVTCIEGTEYHLKRGDICVRKPGQVIYCRGPVDAVLLTLDLSGGQNGQNYSRNILGTVQQPTDNDLILNLNSIIRPVSEYTFIPIYTELLKTAFSDEYAAKNLVMELIYKLNAEQCRKNYIKIKSKETATDIVFKYMKENLSAEITLETLADLVHLDKNYLVRIFRNTYGQTPINALISMRMEYASDLVVNTDMIITDIATACGYNSPSYFTAEYKKHFGITPLKQRKMN